MLQNPLRFGTSLVLGVLTLVSQGYSVSLSQTITSAKAMPAMHAAPKVMPVAKKPTLSPKKSQGPARTAMIVEYTQDISLAPIDPLVAITDPSIKPEHQALAREVLSNLPKTCQSQLRNFYVLYSDPGHRGAAGNGVIIINGLLSTQALRSQLLHEMQHFVDLTCINGTPGSPASVFKDGQSPIPADDPSVAFYSICWSNNTTKKAACGNTAFASNYGASDPFEDFAEFGFEYLGHRERVIGQAKADPIVAQKLAWFQTYYPITTKLAQGSTWDGKIGYSVSKLPYTWLGASVTAQR